MPDWISVEEAAAMSGYNVDHLRLLIRKGKIAADLKGHMYWIDRASLQTYLDDMASLGNQRFNWRRLKKTDGDG